MVPSQLATPLGPRAARILVTLLHEGQRRDAKKGVAALVHRRRHWRGRWRLSAEPTVFGPLQGREIAFMPVAPVRGAYFVNFFKGPHGPVFTCTASSQIFGKSSGKYSNSQGEV